MQYPLLEILNARDVGNIKVFLQHKIGARNFSGGRTQVKFQLTRGWNETWCEIKEIRPELYSLKVYFITGKSSRWKPDPMSPGGMKPPSKGRKSILVDRSGLNAEQVLENFQWFTGLQL